VKKITFFELQRGVTLSGNILKIRKFDFKVD
jgi:hypothetical protein